MAIVNQKTGVNKSVAFARSQQRTALTLGSAASLSSSRFSTKSSQWSSGAGLKASFSAITNKRAVLSQGNRAMLQLFFSV